MIGSTDQLTPAQVDTLARVVELLGEHFDEAVIIVQPNPRSLDIVGEHIGSLHAATSLCESGGHQYLEFGEGDDDDDGGQATIPSPPPTSKKT